MEPEVREVDRAGVTRMQRALVRAFAPVDERADILADLVEEAAQIAAASGRRAAIRAVRWQIAHSIVPWLGRRTRESLARAGRTVPMLHTGLLTDIRFAARRLRHARGFSALAVVTLAIGIGAVSTVFSLAYALWLKPLPYHEPDRLVWIHAQHESGSRASLTAAELAEYGRDSRAFSSVAGVQGRAHIARVDDEPVRIVVYAATPNLFRVLGVPPALGRDLADADVGARVLVLSHGLWSHRFGGDPRAIGRTMVMDGESYEISGVMPRGFTFPRVLSADAWSAAHFEGDGRAAQAVARLAPGSTIEDAAAEVAVRARALAALEGGDAIEWTGAVSPAGVTASRSGRLAYQTLLGIVALFLLIGCTNLAGLLIARNAARRGELAVCLSIGASRSRIARGLLIESAMLASAGCAAGVVLAMYGARVAAAVMPARMPGLDDIGVNVPVVAVAAGASMLAAMMVGLLSALSLRSLRSSEALTGSRAGARGMARGQRLLVCAEIALAVVLLVGASAMLRAFADALGRDRGYDPRGVQALNVSLPFSDDSYLDTALRARVFDDMLARVDAVPGVSQAAATTGFPGSALGILGAAPIRPVEGGPPVSVAIHAASAAYFDTLGTPLRRGRAFTAADTTSAPGVAVVNEQLARLYPDGNPVGRRITLSIFGDDGRSFEIVGVAGDIRLGSQAGNRVFVPLAQVSPYWIDLVFRADTAAAMPAVRRALRAMSPDLLLENESSFQAIISDSLALERAQSAFAAMIGALSTVVAGVGLYALMSFVAAQRRREFGIRLALGSPPRQLFRYAMSSALRLVGAGLLAGMLGATLLVRALGSRVFGLTSADAGTYAAAAALVLAVAVVAAWLPARRVMRTDPLAALRSET
jgi:predicted permease